MRVFVSRALDVLLRRRRDDRLADEVQLHLDLLAYIEQGLSLEQARQAARRAFGGVDQVTAAYRDQRGLPLVDEIAQDVRFAARLLRREPGFAGAAIAVLALGMHEIGVRMALGAQPRQVVRLVARRIALQLAIGFATGVACTRVWDWMFSSGRADVSATDPSSLLAVTLVLTAVATLACLIPARRAARLDPVAAIKHS